MSSLKEHIFFVTNLLSKSFVKLRGKERQIHFVYLSLKSIQGVKILLFKKGQHSYGIESAPEKVAEKRDQ